MMLDLVAGLLIFLALADWAWTAVILRAADRVNEPALTERAIVSVVLSVIATGAALMGAQRLGFVELPSALAVTVLVGALVLVSAPQFIWGAGLVLGKFK